jgi:hypothetical protein
VRRPDTPDAVTDPAEVASAVRDWQVALGAALKTHLAGPFEWRDTLESPYFTDKPGWDGYTALVLWAAHAEHSGYSLPAIAPEEWTPDPAYQLALKEGSEGRYSQLLLGPELWLPPAFSFVFQAKDLTGNPVEMGSVPTLLNQLHQLNDRTWKASAADIEEWRGNGADFGAPLETSARFTYAVFRYCAEGALAHSLPIKLDY